MEGIPEAVTEGGAGPKAVIEGGAAATTKPTSEIPEISEVPVSEVPELTAVSEVSEARARGMAAEAAVETGGVAAAPRLRRRSGEHRV
jgi:hypothetical protein